MGVEVLNEQNAGWKLAKCAKGDCSYIVIKNMYKTIAEATMCNFMNIFELYGFKIHDTSPQSMKFICDEVCKFMENGFSTLHDDEIVNKAIKPILSVECQNEALLKELEKNGFRKSSSIFRMNNLSYVSKRYGTKGGDSLELTSSSGKTIVINIS